MSCASRSVYVPSGSPGNARLRFLPSAGITNGDRSVNEAMLTTGTPVTVPLRSSRSSSRIRRVTAAIDEYSHPCTPPVIETFGPPLPTSKHGWSSPLSEIAVRTTRHYGPPMDPVLRELLLERLSTASLDAEAKRVITLAADAGDEHATTEKATPVWLKSVTVEGFRGIGPEATLELEPAPGLTVVVG